jgi:hypothetical protein
MARIVTSNLSLKPWTALVASVLVIIAGITAGYSYVFATKKELKAVELKQADTGDQRLNEWRLQTLEVQVQNLEIRSRRVDNNLVLLLERFRVTPRPAPVYKPLPRPPEVKR